MKRRLIARFLGSDAALCTEVGRRDGQALVSMGWAGYLLYGPYMALEPGSYRVELYGSADTATVAGAIADICVETGQYILTAQCLQATTDGREGLLANMAFAIDSGRQDMEVRVRVGRIDILKIADGIVPTLLVNSAIPCHCNLLED